MFADEMLQSARLFYDHKPGAVALPDRFDGEEDAVRALMDALLFEAHASMTAPIAMPAKPMLNAVDLESDEPGIIDSVSGGEVNIVRSTARTDLSRFARRQVETVDESAPLPHVPPSKLKRALATAERQEEAKRLRDERAAVKKRVASAARRANREASKAEREASKAESEAGRATAPARAVECDDEGGGDSGCSRECPGEESPLRGKEAAPATPARRDQEVDVEYAAPRADAPAPRRRRREGDALTVHESPVPHDRHIRALSVCAVHSALLPTLLRGEPSVAAGLTIVEGPPGTGKTSRLVDDVVAYMEAHPRHRVLVCAPTNSGVCDLFARALRRGVVGHLSVAKHVIPAGVCRTELVGASQARVLFSTLSGRNAPRLQAQRVHAVFVDEAAQCPEALVWGVLRAEVEALYMVGDTRQLASLVSAEGQRLGHARSMMERLQKIGVRATHLTEQRRMHPEILAFPNARFYAGELRTAADRGNRTTGAAYELVDVHGAQERVGTSFRNAAEAEVCVRLAKALPYDTVCILAPYAAQVECILGLGAGVQARTVDSFQGQEADAIVLSLVRVGEEGFWSDDRRLNVALTRARHALRVVGNLHSFPRGGTLAQMVQDADARGCVARRA